jgi:hypothetical protein
MPERTEQEEQDEEQQVLSFLKRTHGALGAGINKLEKLKKKRSAGKAPSIEKNKGRPASE